MFDQQGNEASRYVYYHTEKGINLWHKTFDSNTNHNNGKVRRKRKEKP